MSVRLPTDERIGPEVISIIPDRLLFGSPPGLKLPQPMIFRLGSPKAKAVAPLPDGQSDRFPHCEIIGPELLVRPVGCPVFVDRLSPVVKADCPRDIHALIGSQRDKSKTFRNYIFVYFFKKKKWLRRKTMFLSCQSVQPVKFLYRFPCRESGNGHPLLDSLLDVPPRTVPKARINRFFRTRKIQDMTVIRVEYRYRAGKRHRVSDLDVSPTGHLPVSDNRMHGVLHIPFLTKNRHGIIGKWEGDTSPPCQKASYFHKRDNPFQCPVP